MLTTGGELVPFQVDADDDPRDLVVAVKGKNAFVSLQAKACFSLGPSGIVQSNAIYTVDSIPTDPAWIYVIVLILDLAPAPDFNRLAARSAARHGRRIELHFGAHPKKQDRFTPFRTETKDVGPRLLEIIAALPPATKPLAGARLFMTTRPGPLRQARPVPLATRGKRRPGRALPPRPCSPAAPSPARG